MNFLSWISYIYDVSMDFLPMQDECIANTNAGFPVEICPCTINVGVMILKDHTRPDQKKVKLIENNNILFSC